MQQVRNGSQSGPQPTGGEYTALRQNRQVVDEWQSRIRMEQSVDALSLKNIKLGFVYI